MKNLIGKTAKYIAEDGTHHELVELVEARDRKRSRRDQFPG